MPGISTETIKYVIAHAFKDLQFLIALKDRVDHYCFYPSTDLLYSYVWDVLVTYYETYNELLDAESGRVLTHQLVFQDNVAISSNDIDALFDYISKVETDAKIAKELANKWLLSRVVADNVSAELQSSEDVVGVLDTGVTKARKLVINDVKVRKILDNSNLVNKVQNLIPTGVYFFDSKINGGLAPKEVAILLGPTKAGKTTLAVQLACSSAALARETNDKRKVAFVLYEDSFDVAVVRIISHLARIPRDRLTQVSLDGLSTEALSQMYENDLIQNDFRTLKSEVERVKDIEWIDEHLVVIDHSGRSGDYEAGCRGVDELVEALKAHDPEQNGYRLVIIDWLGLLLNRYLEFKGVRDITKELSFRLRSLPDELFRKIADPFDVPVLGVHQLSGAANKKGPVDKVDHTDAEWCKSIGVMAWHVFVLQQPDKQNQVSVFNTTISRRCPPTEPTLIKLDGRFGTFYDVTNDYVIDSATRRILAKAEASENFKKTMRKHVGRFEI